MPFDVGEVINKFADNLAKSPIVSFISNNPINTALFVVVIIMLIIVFIFRDADTDEPLLVMALRSGFWIFLMLVGTLFLHNKALLAEHSTDVKNDNYEKVFDESYANLQTDKRPSIANMVMPIPTQVKPITQL